MEAELGPGALQQRIEQQQAKLREEATIQLDDEDAARARAAAQRRGMNLQTFLKMIVHEALHQEKSSPNA